MKIMNSILAILSAVAMLLTSSGPAAGTLPEDPNAAVQEQEESELPYGRHTVVPFDEIEYVRPDPDAITDAVHAAVELARQGTDAEQVVDKITACDEAYYTASTMYTYAEIRYYLDMTDDYWAEEYDFCSEAILELDILFDEMYVDLAASPVAKELEELYYGDGFVDYYTGDYIGYSDETYAELSRQEGELLSQYRELQADPTVEYRGKEVSYYDVMSDPNVSYSYYAAVEELYYEKYTPLFGEVYIELVKVRNEIAEYCGYDSYEAYAYDYVYERDYTPEDVDRMLDEIKTEITPLYEELYQRMAWARIDYEEMDEAAVTELIAGIAEEMGGDIAETWQFLDDYNLYDFSISPNKVDMSFQTYLEDFEAPYAFVKTTGYNDDLLTVAHEFGHCVDSYVNYNDTYSLDIAEIYSQAMEYLALCVLEEELKESDLKNLTKMKLLDTLDTYAQQGSFVDFERQVYSLPEEELTVERINEISLQTSIDYGYMEEGYEEYYSRSWIDIVHFFEYPCYVVSYCVSCDAAFQIYQAELAEPGSGIELFNRILPRDYDGFSETLELQGEMANPFDAGRMKSTADMIRDYFT